MLINYTGDCVAAVPAAGDLARECDEMTKVIDESLEAVERQLSLEPAIT